MVFYLGVIHSDPHPGNMLIRSADKASSLRKVVLKVLGPSRVMSRNFEIVLRKCPAAPCSIFRSFVLLI